ncbi:MAG: hypothetical protein NTU83_15410, partial [Candidatus Hydrogenedentes bacterium]|nr:hypothetical protein [Candidatus Hydrogenedentota bacterium]
MDILLQAVKAVQRNAPALGLYLLFTVPVSALVLAGNMWMGDTNPDAPVSAAMLAYEVAGDAFLIVAYAFAQSIAFSRMGRLLDRPLWKCPGDGEALKRYFPLWVLLNIVAFGSQRLVTWVPALMDNEAAAAPMFWIMAIVVAVYLPFGAAIMFAGRPRWRELGEALGPLGRQWPKALSVCFFSGITYMLLTILIIWQPESQRWLLPVLDVIAGYFDCLIFCATWLICMFDRQTPQ